MGNLVLPQTFSAMSAQGQWESFPFTCEPIFVAALEIAQSTYHRGPREVFRNIAFRSSTVNAVNNLLNAGGSIEGAALSGPALIGIPAEAYPAQPQPWWRKLLPFWRKILSWYYRRSNDNTRNA
jgi:hypothetical protein